MVGYRLNGMSECLESPYFNYSEQRWRQNVNQSASKPDEDSCEAYIGFQGAVQTYWQDESRIDCVSSWCANAVVV